MKSLLPLRAVLVTGKGGVGKTTVSASIARYLAAAGRRVLCAEISSEESESSPLAEALGLARLHEEPVEVGPNLRAAALTPLLGHQRFLRDVMPVRMLADAAMKTAAIRRFLAAAPTFPEMGVLYRLLDLVRTKRSDGTPEYESIVVDLPATGHALALAQIPKSILRVIPTGPVAAAVREGLALLVDPARTGVVIVTLPETLPVSEAIELVAGIREHQIPIAQVVVNRVPVDPFSDEERAVVRALLRDKPPTLGQRTVERIDRANAAVARVRGGIDAPVAILNDVFLESPRLAEEMASLMKMEGAA